MSEYPNIWYNIAYILWTLYYSIDNHIQDGDYNAKYTLPLNRSLFVEEMVFSHINGTQ